MGFLRYMRGSIGKRLTVKHLTTVCLQSDKGQVKQLSLYSHTVFFATLRRTLRATVHFGAHTWESGVLIRSCARMHSSVLIREHLLSEKLTFALDGHGSAYEQHLSDRRLHDRVESIISVHSVTSMLCISSLTDTPDKGKARAALTVCSPAARANMHRGRTHQRRGAAGAVEKLHALAPLPVRSLIASASSRS